MIPDGLHINDYDELASLHKLMMLAKFQREPLDLYVFFSPFVAEVLDRLVNTLTTMEEQRGKSVVWKSQIDPSGEVWRIAVNNTINMYKNIWRNLSNETKRKIVAIGLSPFVFTQEMQQEFIRQVERSMAED